MSGVTKKPYGRIITGIIAIGLLIFGFAAMPGWWSYRSKYKDAYHAEIADLGDCLAKQGVYQTAFNPAYQFTCQEALIVEHSLEEKRYPSLSSIIDGLDADLVIADESGKIVHEAKLIPDEFIFFCGINRSKHDIPAYTFWPIPKGEYQLTLTVHQPARPLAEVPHRVVFIYEMCGIESLVLYIHAAFCFVPIFLAVLIFTIIIKITYRKRSKRSEVL